MNQIKFQRSNRICYFIVPKKGSSQIQTINGGNKLVIEDLENENISRIANIRIIEKIYFNSNTLMKNLEIENINEIIKQFEDITKIKLFGYLTNQNSVKLFFPDNLEKLSIHNLLYPNFNIFTSIQDGNINTFKLSNYKFTSNSHLNDFFNFILNVKVKNLILKDIFIEILDIKDEGTITSYFNYCGNKIEIIKNNQPNTCELESLYLSNCRLININFDKFSTLNSKIKTLSIINNSILIDDDRYDSILELKQVNNEFSITIDCQYLINKCVLDIIEHNLIEKIKFINCDSNKVLKGNQNWKKIIFKYCCPNIISQYLNNNTNIQNLSIKEPNYINNNNNNNNNNNFVKNPIKINNKNCFSGDNNNLSLCDTFIVFEKRRYNILKISIFTLENKDLADYFNNLIELMTYEHNTLILEGNIFNLIKKNLKYKSNKIVLKNIIADKSIENDIKNSNILEKNIYFYNCFFFICGKQTTYLDYNTFNNVIFVNNEFNDLIHFINCSIFEEKTKFTEKYNTIYNIMQLFYNNNICFQINNQIEFRNIVLTLINFFKNSENKLIEEFKDNFIVNDDKTKVLSKYYFTEEQIKIIDDLKNISFTFNQKKIIDVE